MADLILAIVVSVMLWAATALSWHLLDNEDDGEENDRRRV